MAAADINHNHYVKGSNNYYGKSAFTLALGFIFTMLGFWIVKRMNRKKEEAEKQAEQELIQERERAKTEKELDKQYTWREKHTWIIRSVDEPEQYTSGQTYMRFHLSNDLGFTRRRYFFKGSEYYEAFMNKTLKIGDSIIIEPPKAKV